MSLPKWLKKTVVASTFFGTGLGLGAMGTFILLLSDNPSIIIQDRWRVVEVPTPPSTLQPMTPFGIDPNVYILDLPVTTTTTRKSLPTTTTSVTTMVPETTTTTTVVPETTTTTVASEPTTGQKL